MVLSRKRAALAKLISFLSKKEVALLSHSRPDLDSAGSLIALHSLLPYSKIYLNKPRRDVELLFRALKVGYEEGKPPKGVPLIVVDTHSRNLSGTENAFLVIDHHQKDNFPLKARHKILEPSYSSCSELVYDLLGPSLSRVALFALSVGIASDTVFFKFASSKTLSKFASMLESSGHTMKDVVRFTSAELSIEERSMVIDAIRCASWVFVGNIVIVFSLTKANASTVAKVLSETSDLVFVGEEGEGGTKISARSSGITGIALNSLMASLAKKCKGYGGGHRNAAGAFVRAPPQDAFHQLLLLLEPCLHKRSQSKI